MSPSSVRPEPVLPADATAGTPRSPQRPIAGGELSRTGQVDGETGLPAVDWQPIEAPMRIVGPGRREVRLRAQLTELEQSLEVAQLLERGTARYVDRMEEHLDESRSQVARLAAAMGSLATENQALLKALAQAERRIARIEAPQPSRWSRFLASVTGRQA